MPFGKRRSDRWLTGAPTQRLPNFEALARRAGICVKGLSGVLVRRLNLIMSPGQSWGGDWVTANWFTSKGAWHAASCGDVRRKCADSRHYRRLFESGTGWTTNCTTKKVEPRPLADKNCRHRPLRRGLPKSAGLKEN